MVLMLAIYRVKWRAFLPPTIAPAATQATASRPGSRVWDWVWHRKPPNLRVCLRILIAWDGWTNREQGHPIVVSTRRPIDEVRNYEFGNRFGRGLDYGFKRAPQGLGLNLDQTFVSQIGRRPRSLQTYIQQILHLLGATPELPTPMSFRDAQRKNGESKPDGPPGAGDLGAFKDLGGKRRSHTYTVCVCARMSVGHLQSGPPTGVGKFARYLETRRLQRKTKSRA